MKFTFNTSHIKDDGIVQRGIDEVMIEILDMKQPENIAGYLVYFKPIAGNYIPYLPNPIIIDGVWQSVLSYSIDSKAKVFDKFKGEK